MTAYSATIELTKPHALGLKTAYSGIIDLTNALGPKVAKFNSKCLDPEEKVQLLGKVEFLNPASHSHKDRIARAIISKARDRGELTDSNGHKKSILAASSGNTGHALCKLGTEMGYKVIIITTNKCSKEKCDNIRSNGGELWMSEETPSRFPNELEGLDYMEQEQVICQNYPDKYFSVNQYDNLDNMMAHYETTAEEIWDQSQGRVTHFIMAASTGGSIMGVGKCLKEKTDNNVSVVLSDPHKSHLAGLFEKARGNVAKGEEILRGVNQAIEKEGPIQIEGAGKSCVTKIMTYGGGILKYVDDTVIVHDFDAFDMCRKIDNEYGIKIGGSAGMNVKACQVIAEQLIDEGKADGAVLTTLLCDNGNKYKSKIFNDKWMQENDPRVK